MHDIAATDLIANSRQESQRVALEGRSKEGLFEIRKMNEIECHFIISLVRNSQGCFIAFEISFNPSVLNHFVEQYSPIIE